MAKVVKPNQLTKALTSALESLEAEGKGKAERVYRAAAIDLFSRVILATPVDEGRLRGNWFVTTNRPSNKKTNSPDTSKGGEYVSGKTPKNLFDFDKLFLTNNLPYAQVVEFGGYPKSPKKGTRNKQTKKFEIRSKNGFSKIAPRGMVRINMRKFNQLIKRALRRVK